MNHNTTCNEAGFSWETAERDQDGLLPCKGCKHDPCCSAHPPKAGGQCDPDEYRSPEARLWVDRVGYWMVRAAVATVKGDLDCRDSCRWACDVCFRAIPVYGIIGIVGGPEEEAP